MSLLLSRTCLKCFTIATAKSSFFEESNAHTSDGTFSTKNTSDPLISGAIV